LKNFDPIQIRKDFPIYSKIDKPFIYLDNAATTQRPSIVLNELNNYYTKFNANVHRAVYSIGEQATQAYENAREKIANFIGVDNSSIIFTRGTTESINLVAYAWARNNLSPNDEVLVTEMEHHSNLVPWQLAAKATGASLKYIPLNEDGTLDLNDPDQYFNNKTKFVAVIHQSNVLGTINPIKQIVEMAHHVGAKTLIDGAQWVPHGHTNLIDIDSDFYAFSGHKMLGPTGVGILYGKQEILEEMEPFQGGGEMIKSVTMNDATWNEIPYKFEAGTPNIAQAIGLGAAVQYINDLGLNNIHRHGERLTKYALDKLNQINGLKIHGNQKERGPVISFEIENIHPQDLAQFLDQDGIAIRAGQHCTQPIMDKLGVFATSRASFYIYNTENDIDTFCKSIEKTASVFK
jgi:cysteine desulfurase/selenocysteine lyase